MNYKVLVCLAAYIILGLSLCAHADQLPAEPNYHREIAPILAKYCVGCHADDAPEGELSLESYASLMKGGSRGAVVNAGHPELSRLTRVLTGAAEPAMPPDDSEPPSAEEVAKLAAWIKAGAPGPEGDPPPLALVTPAIAPQAELPREINDLALLPGGQLAAHARYGELELVDRESGQWQARLSVGKSDLNVLEVFPAESLLAAAGGVPGLNGEVHLWRINSLGGRFGATELASWTGHRDSVYALAFSLDGALLATGGYDREIKIWNVADQNLLHTFTTHNDTVYDLAFHPGGRILASASADRTVKLWDAVEGRRLDTLGQSLEEVYAVAFHPDGKQLAAAGVDNRIRVWSISGDAGEGSNPLDYSRFAHDEPILRLAYSADGRLLLSAAEDRLVKAWDTASMRLQAVFDPLEDWPSGLAIDDRSQRVVVAMRNGATQSLSLEKLAALEADAVPLPEYAPSVSYGPQPKIADLPRTAEAEPNDRLDQPTPLPIPGVATGAIHRAGEPRDRDLFRITAKAGEQWIIETNAARSKSPLDSKIEVLHGDGSPVVRMILRAVRDSELEFRGMTSQARGARLKNYEEMLLNQFIYVGGDVMKHYQQRRGPDSDAQMYPEGGNRYAYFDTTPRAHALGEPAYVVVPYPADARLPDNGLPKIPLYFENDDQSKQQLGKDSQLTFTAPADGDYLVAVSDVRGFSGSDYSYRLIVRRPEPDYSVSIEGANPTLSAGGGKGVKVKANRADGFEGEITVTIDQPPEGYFVTSPIVIGAGLTEAHGVLYAAADAAQPAADASAMKLTASAAIDGQQVEHAAGDLGKLKLAEKSKIRVYIEPIDSQPKAPPTIANGFAEPPAITIAPGTTVTCRLRIEREGFDARVGFDVLNLPHGVIVDNIGLNGVLMPEGETERILYLTAEPWVPETDRLFHAVAQAEGNQASLPMLLRVRKGQETASK